MKVKHLLLMLCLTTGLSLGGLYGCGGGEKTSDKDTSTTIESGETVSDENREQNFYSLLLLNIIVLLGATGTCIFLVYKNNQTKKEDNAFLIKLEPEEAQQTTEQIRAKKELDTNLKRIQESLQEIKDSFSISTNLETNKKNTLIIGLNNKQYNELIELINKLGQILDDTYIAMLRYNSFAKYDQALKLAIEKIQESIDEHLKGLENTPIDQDKLKQAINSSLSTIQLKIDSILQKVQSFPPNTNNSQNTTPVLNNTFTEDEKQQFNDRIQSLTEERNKYEQELQEKDHQIAQFKTGEIEKIQQEYQQLFNQHQELNDNYTKIYPYYENYQTIEKERDDIITELNEVRQQLQEKIDRKDQKIEELTGEVERLKAAARREPPQDNQLSSQWQALINAYLLNPETIRNNAIDEVMEDDYNHQERRINASQTFIFSSNKSANGYYTISSGSDHLLFPKQHGIPVSQKSTAREVFEGYKSGNTSKFTSIIPAQVISVGNGMWELKNKGRLEYS